MKYHSYYCYYIKCAITVTISMSFTSTSTSILTPALSTLFADAFLNTNTYTYTYTSGGIPVPVRVPSTQVSLVTPSSNKFSDAVGTSALERVKSLASRVTQANSFYDSQSIFDDNNTDNLISETVTVTKSGSTLYSDLQLQQNVAQGKNRKVVLSALESLEKDMQMLDDIAGQEQQLSPLELTLLSMSALVAACGPILFPDGARITEVLAPAAAAFSAAIGIGAEYTGKVAVADGKEVAAETIKCAAEAEGLLANAERVKAVTPLCVGIGATAASFALLAPVLLESFGISNLQVATELYLLSPLVAVLSASVSSLALQETKSFSSRAISIGNRRFAKSGLVGRTWLSTSEQIERNSQRISQRWKSFAASVLPAPIIGSIIPGSLSTKAIVVAALAAAQSAYFLAQAENTLARATDAVALKARSAAVCDTYANQGARSAAILPFTSALSSLCAAATAAIVELPLLHNVVHIGGPVGALSGAALVGFFPSLSSLFAAAASVSKARCQVDSEAAIQAAATLALEYEEGDDPVLRPFRGVVELIRLTASTTWKSLKSNRLVKNVMLFFRIWKKKSSDTKKNG